METFRAKMQQLDRMQPVKKTLLGWAIIIPTGLFIFKLAMDDIGRRRRGMMKERRRLRASEILAEQEAGRN